MNNQIPIVSLSFFTYSIRDQFWALKQMQQSKTIRYKLHGTSFAKLLGTGGGKFGFSIKPDFSTYALLCVWKNAAEAKTLESHHIFTQLKGKSHTSETYYMACTQSHGAWDGVNPLVPAVEYQSGPMFTLTRASLSAAKLLAFWTHVPATTRALEKSNGLLFSKGVGELPIIEQATFSHWENSESMLNFAYKSEHTQVLIKAKKQNWFKEELFARFIPVNLEDW
ncbi:hypothetical protein [Anditalea andensis]|uniref:Spheroidene monooxygenase n=1 Tax=Anditalea andensis TaxID=1048983 RepID=A0A074L487_9BACT|nr:hypothetical protein [Anditalea andensis]KEO75295.1 hypothetical protein EL17_01775 [Anditalea andensis]